MAFNLDQFWEDIFSEDAARVHRVWNDLTSEERAAVRHLLERIDGDAQRIEAQRLAARFALSTLEADVETEVRGAQPNAVSLPEGALEFARTLARDTALHLKTTFGQLTASLKRDGTLVTQSDIEADLRLSEAILARYPSHGILSEERDRVFHGQRWCWVIDPIDGTTNFTWGFPAWGVLIALLHDGQPMLGVADFPMTNEQFYATRGGGAWLNDRPIRVALIEEEAGTGLAKPQTSHLFACCTRTLRYGLPNVPMKVRIAGTTGYDLALVARGACVGSLDMTSHVWDVAALWPLVEEAGGVIKTNLAQGLFPLAPQTDYSVLTFSVVSACSQPMLNLLEDRLRDRFMVSS